MTYRLIIAVLVLFGMRMQAQEKRSFSLEEAVTFALDSNYTAINSQRDIAIAIKKKWETTATGLPQITGLIDYQNQIIQPTSFIPAEFFGGAPGTFSPVVFGTKQNASATATLNQLIFDGSYLVGLKAARTFLDFTENANEKTQLEVRKGVINAYGSVLLAQEGIKILDRNITTLEKNVNETAIIFKNGLAEEEDVEQLQITLSSLQNMQANAVRMEKIAKQMFNLALGIDIYDTVILTETLDSLAVPALALMNATKLPENNVDLKIAANLTEQRELELQLEKSKALPTLSGFINLGTNAGRNEFDFFDGDQRWFASSIAGVSLNVPIFSSGMRSARTQQATIALDQAATQLEETQQQIQLAYESAKSDHELAIDNYATSKKNLALAERIENKNQIKFKEGLSTSFELRQAQVQLYTTQQELIQSMLSIITTKADLETILNTPDYRNTRN
ncbi:MAG: outer membrane protein [Flavobacteriales bacterium]|jgi:outer membrane protein